MIDNRNVGRTIATLRSNKGLTQQQLAAVLNVSHQAVSKWENGAALPDIQTMVDLTQLFGITIEQLLSGEVAQTPPEAPAADDPIRAAGRAVSSLIDDIGNIFRTEPAQPAAEEDDGAANAVMDDAAPLSQGDKPVTLQTILQMAPFMSRQALEDVLRRRWGTLSVEEAVSFAPFVGKEFLEKLLSEDQEGLDWEKLRQLAPFLRREAVDAFARAILSGGKYERPKTDAERMADGLQQTIGDVSRTISTGFDNAVKSVVKLGENVAGEVSRAFEGLTGDNQPTMSRVRRSVFERAIEDGRWDWIEAHLDEVTDEEMRKDISERANEAGMQDWVARNLGSYADEETIREAIAAGNWGWLEEHVWQFEPEMQQMVALAAMRAENWQWLGACAERLSLGDAALEIAEAARKAGARILAVQMARYDMDEVQVAQAALNAVDAQDFEYLDMVRDLLGSDVLCKCCIRMGRLDRWDAVEKFADALDVRGLEWLTEAALDQGDFDAIDMLDARIRAKQQGQEQK